MPHFITCSKSSFLIGDKEIANNPVNMDLCTTFYKLQHIVRYAGSKPMSPVDTISFPAIHFEGCGVYWIFQNERDRDCEWLLVMHKCNS